MKRRNFIKAAAILPFIGITLAETGFNVNNPKRVKAFFGDVKPYTNCRGKIKIDGKFFTYYKNREFLSSTGGFIICLTHTLIAGQPYSWCSKDVGFHCIVTDRGYSRKMFEFPIKSWKVEYEGEVLNLTIYD